MNFDQYLGNVQRFTSREQLLQAIEKTNPASMVSVELATSMIRRITPNYMQTPEQQAQQGQRRELQQRLVNKVVDMVLDRSEAERTTRPSIRQFSRGIKSLLSLPKSREADFQRLYPIFSGTDEKAKSREYISEMDKALEGMTAEDIRNMNDEQLVENFEKIVYINGIVANLDIVASHSEYESLSLKEEQRQKMIQIRNNFQSSVMAAYYRLMMISEPYYVQFPPETLFTTDFNTVKQELDDYINQTGQKQLKPLGEYISFSGGYVRAVCVDWKMRIQMDELNGVPSRDITWLDGDGKPIRQTAFDGTDLGNPDSVPVDKLLSGKPLVAQFPDGTMKVFSTRFRNGIPDMVSGGPKMLTEYMNKEIPGALKELQDGLDNADRRYIKSSKEFKNIQSTLEKLRGEWKALDSNPTEDQREKLTEQMVELVACCEEYFYIKKDKKKFNTLETNRLAAVRAVSDFAKKQLSFINVLHTHAVVESRRRSTAEAGEEARILGNLKNERSSGMEDFHQKEMDKTPEGALKAYKQLQIPRSNAVFDVEGLHQDTVGRIALQLNQSTEEPLVGGSAENACTAMAQMILVDLVLKERFRNRFNPKAGQNQAGSLEKFLGRSVAGKPGVDVMLQNIKNSQTFLENAKNLTGKTFESFLMDHKARSISSTIFSELFPKKEQEKQNTDLDAQTENKEEATPQKTSELAL